MKKNIQEKILDKETDLIKELEEANKIAKSKIRPIWQGILFGIGSTIGLAIILYLLSTVLQPLKYLPILGDLIREEIQPTIEQKTPSVLK